MFRFMFRCPQCDGEVIDTAEGPAYSPDETEDDSYEYVETTIKCPACGSDHQVQVRNFGDGWYIELPDNHSVKVEILDGPRNIYLDEEFQKWLDDTPTFPKRMFFSSLKEFEAIEQLAPPPKDGQQSFYRMLYSQHFAAFEAYLATRLTNLVADYPAALKALVLYHKEFSTRTITYATALDDQDIIRRRVVVELNNMVWHKLANVDHYYKGVFGETIFPDKNVSKFLFAQVQVRHDCVHRNGRNKDGEKITITSIDLDNLRNAMLSVVDRIETMYADYNKRPERSAFNRARIAQLLAPLAATSDIGKP